MTTWTSEDKQTSIDFDSVSPIEALRSMLEAGTADDRDWILAGTIDVDDDSYPCADLVEEL